MTSFRRLIFPTPSFAIEAATLWRAAWAALALSAFIVARAFSYELGPVVGYFGYFALYVALPGAVVMYAVNRGPISLAPALALGLPTGFAVEIFTYLGLSALEAKEVYIWIPVVWVALALGIRLRRGEWPVRVRVSAHHAGIWLALCAAFFGTVLIAASQMFAEAPLANGLPTRAIFHDWMYLVSRAGVIKNNWPLDDPSLAGTPLQYHYFMMVHAAAASWTTGVELSAVMLRLLYLPLGAALVAQAYVLGRAVSRSPWGGVIAALLTVIVSEASFSRSYSEPMFLGLFLRWLFVSPTFFFGVVFCGALLIAVHQCTRLARCDARHYGWLLLLGAAGTGAKGTVLPVLGCALGLWTLWRWSRERRFTLRPVLIGGCLATAFLVVYVPMMSAWGKGDAAFNPFHVFQLTSFWKTVLPVWQQGLAQWLPANVATPLASVLCALVVFAGTCGVRLLALPYLFWGDRRRRDAALVGWIGAFFVASAGMGMLMELNSYGELYLILMMRLPMAVLTAGFVLAAYRRCLTWWREPAAQLVLPQGPSRLPPGMSFKLRRFLLAGALTAVAVTGTVQTTAWWSRNSSGLREFLRTPVDLKPDRSMEDLREALLWVRRNTEPNAVLVANACTPENMKKDHWGALDRTLTGVHFYYSALSERRLWFEGPNYILDTTRARQRAGLASDFFYRGQPLLSETVSDDPTYVLIDRSLADNARVTLPQEARLFSNARMKVYRLPKAGQAIASVDGGLR
ncbi:hypothetical protein [Horticoccus sp. 23ND18S-11]|uniref:hypothetical protein n=1 Tax=Horticoccus sp. 23ND18S-11 TaxID=3391832 RepID=UPI0039C8FE05